MNHSAIKWRQFETSICWNKITYSKSVCKKSRNDQTQKMCIFISARCQYYSPQVFNVINIDVAEFKERSSCDAGILYIWIDMQRHSVDTAAGELQSSQWIQIHSIFWLNRYHILTLRVFKFIRFHWWAFCFASSFMHNNWFSSLLTVVLCSFSCNRLLQNCH